MKKQNIEGDIAIQATRGPYKLVLDAMNKKDGKCRIGLLVGKNKEPKMQNVAQVFIPIQKTSDLGARVSLEEMGIALKEISATGHEVLGYAFHQGKFSVYESTSFMALEPNMKRTLKCNDLIAVITNDAGDIAVYK